MTANDKMRRWRYIIWPIFAAVTTMNILTIVLLEQSTAGSLIDVIGQALVSLMAGSTIPPRWSDVDKEEENG